MTQLPIPTSEAVLEAAATFDSDPSTGPADRALTLLFQQYPQNTDLSNVLVKVASLNALYSTNIYALVPVAEHICACNLDPVLALGSPEAVDLIAGASIGGKPRHIFSFATKYCSWHNPAGYPIYDRFVEACLMAYRRQDGFARFRTDGLRSGATFVQVVSAFRDFYGLAELGFKQLDKFLWLQGKALKGAGT